MARALRLALLACAALLPACTSPAEVGAPCTDSADCAGGLSCISTSDPEVFVCMPDCDLTMERLCDGGEVCIDPPPTGGGTSRPENLGICYLGGDVSAGDPCVDTSECERGSQCIDQGGTTTCQRACTVGAEGGCGAGETCVMVSGAVTPNAGVCQTAP